MLALVLAHFAAALAAPALVAALGRRAFLLLAAVPAAAVAWAVAHTAEVADGDVVTETVSWVPTLGLDLAFAMGSLQWVMVLVVAGVGTLVLVYSAWYFGDDEPGLPAFAGHFVAFAGAMLGLVVADDLLLLYVFWELTTVFSYLLIGHDPTRRAARSAGLQALIVTTLGGLAMLVGILIIGVQADTFRISAILADPPSGTAVTVAVSLLVWSVAFGVVVGFPLLTALALEHVTAAHSIVFVGLLPLATAAFGVLRGGERPRPVFWLFAVAGSLSVAGFALAHSDSTSLTGDLLMVAAILLCGFGYAEGAVLSRRLGGRQVISWALVLALPVMAVIGLATLPGSWRGIGLPAWAGLAYVSVFSMLVGFVFWYRGLALGGIAGVGQLQLLQPFLGLARAGLLLREPVAWSMIAATAVAVLCVAGAKRFV